LISVSELDVQGLVKHFPITPALVASPRAVVRAVDDVTFNVDQGETLGIVGESGCGKSTIARLLTHLIAPDAGVVTFGGRIAGSPELSMISYRRHVQMVLQDSAAPLNPRLTIGDSIVFAATAHGIARSRAIRQAWSLLRRVGLDPLRLAGQHPHQLSAGQRQQVNIARALALEPSVLILDEPVAGLDKAMALQVVNLLLGLKEELGLTYIFITRDLDLVRFFADRVMVMMLGKIAEMGRTEVISRGRRHPYTEALLASMSSVDPDRPTTAAALAGDVSTPMDPPGGCRFHTRCRYADSACSAAQPAAHLIGDEHLVACHRVTAGSGNWIAPAGLRRGV
jgi:peptide/nickel transport system ATP-binding protein